MPSRSMLALFTAIGGQLWDNDQTRLAKAILSTNAVLFQSQPCDACFRCSMKFTSTYTIPVGQFDTGLIAFDGSARNPSPRTTRTCGGPGLRSRGRRPRPCSASASVFLAYSAAAVANALCFETEQLEEVGRIDEDLPRFAKACLAAEFAPHGCGLGKVAGGDVMPNLVPLGWRQYRPQGLVRSYETIEPRGPILAGPTRRLVEEEDPAGADGAADCLHQAQLVLGREVMDREAAPGRVGMLGLRIMASTKSR